MGYIWNTLRLFQKSYSIFSRMAMYLDWLFRLIPPCIFDTGTTQNAQKLQRACEQVGGPYMSFTYIYQKHSYTSILYIYMSTFVYKHVYICIYIYMSIYLHICISTHIYISQYMYICIDTSVNLFLYISSHLYIYI